VSDMGKGAPKTIVRSRAIGHRSGTCLKSARHTGSLFFKVPDSANLHSQDPVWRVHDMSGTLIKGLPMCRALFKQVPDLCPIARLRTVPKTGTEYSSKAHTKFCVKSFSLQ